MFVDGMFIVDNTVKIRSVIGADLLARGNFMTIQGMFSVQLTDPDGDVKPLELYTELPDTATLGDMQTYAGLLAGFLDPITDVKITKLSSQLLFTTPAGLKADAVAGSDVQEGGLISCHLVGSTYRYGLFVPGIKESLKAGNSLTMAAMIMTNFTGFISASQSNIWGTNQFGKRLAAPFSGAKKFRK